VHWIRNLWNEPVSYQNANTQWQKLPTVQSVFHQMGLDNKNNEKFVSPDGHSEAVFKAGYLITDPINQGTYNFFSPNFLFGIPHTLTDIIPYFIFGNSPSDMFTSDRFKTLCAMLIFRKF